MRFALKTALSLALLIALACVFMSSAADATHSRFYGHGFGAPDSNGYVPEYYPWTVGTCYDNRIALTHYEHLPKSPWGPSVMWIEYDVCEMYRLGATQADWQELKEHERAHGRGFAHGEGHPSYNAAYHPTVPVG